MSNEEERVTLPPKKIESLENNQQNTEKEVEEIKKLDDNELFGTTNHNLKFDEDNLFNFDEKDLFGENNSNKLDFDTTEKKEKNKETTNFEELFGKSSSSSKNTLEDDLFGNNSTSNTTTTTSSNNIEDDLFGSSFSSSSTTSKSNTGDDDLFSNLGNEKTGNQSNIITKGKKIKENSPFLIKEFTPFIIIQTNSIKFHQKKKLRIRSQLLHQSRRIESQKRWRII